MFAFDVYRAETWHAPLEIDSDILLRGKDQFFLTHRDDSKEPYEAWFHDGRVLTAHMMNEAYSLNKTMVTSRRRFEIRVGEVAFIMARFPALIKSFGEEDINNLRSDGYLDYLRKHSFENESLAWFFELRLGHWKWNDDFSNDRLLDCVDELHQSGVGFDQAQPYIAAGVTDTSVIIEALETGIDVELSARLAESATI